MRITTTARPYTLTFNNSGHRYALTSAEAQRLIDAYPTIRATRNRVILQGCFTRTPTRAVRAADRTVITRATLGGGDAFVIER